MSLGARTICRVVGTPGSWRIASADEPESMGVRVEMRLEIQGSPRDGFHLLMSPVGHFTADTWHETESEARRSALEIFGIPVDAWAYED
jgi:hypothetical protein